MKNYTELKRNASLKIRPWTESKKGDFMCKCRFYWQP